MLQVFIFCNWQLNFPKSRTHRMDSKNATVYYLQSSRPEPGYGQQQTLLFWDGAPMVHSVSVCSEPWLQRAHVMPHGWVLPGIPQRHHMLDFLSSFWLLWIQDFTGAICFITLHLGRSGLEVQDPGNYGMVAAAARRPCLAIFGSIPGPGP